METYVAFLRGINVGGKNKVAMTELKAMFVDAGMVAPQTVLQSGNVVFQSTDVPEAALEADLADRFLSRWGFESKFHIRRASELLRTIDANPFPAEAESDPSHLVVIFLRDSLAESDLSEVTKAIKGRESVCLGERVLYVWYPDGIGTSTLDRTPGWSRLAKDGTARNWNTVKKLTELTLSFG